jgi:uncharacterized protein YdeI (YjbR/CyaY-like superfamily)
MGKRDPRVDAYIASAADFAQPILTDIREAVHAACPNVEETMKWRFPHFVYKGMLCGTAAFKQHAALGFWKGELVTGRVRGVDAMGQFGRITKRSDLPSASVLRALVKKAAELNEQGVNVPRAPKKAAPKTVAVPSVLSAALLKNKKARAGFNHLSPSHKREYIEWINDAKADETRARRLAQAIEWIAEGKSRNWKYERRN